MKLGIGHSDLGEATLVASILLPSSVLGLLVVSGMLAVVVGDDATHRGLRSVGTSEGELLTGQHAGLLTDDAERNPGIVMVSKFSVLLFKPRKIKNKIKK